MEKKYILNKRRFYKFQLLCLSFKKILFVKSSSHNRRKEFSTFNGVLYTSFYRNMNGIK